MPVLPRSLVFIVKTAVPEAAAPGKSSVGVNFILTWPAIAAWIRLEARRKAAMAAGASACRDAGHSEPE